VRPRVITQPHVEQNPIEAEAAAFDHGVVSGRGVDEDPEAAIGQELRGRAEQGQIIVDDQDGRTIRFA
jgi:hypothetical protein